MSDMPELPMIWLTEVDHEDPDFPILWASASADSGGIPYVPVRAVQEAVAAERARCAAIADAEADMRETRGAEVQARGLMGTGFFMAQSSALDIAAAIRDMPPEVQP